MIIRFLKSKLFILWLFIIFFAWFCSALSVAGEYVLVTGKDKEVCRQYGTNLNSFKDLPHAMACERKLNPELTDFRAPDWQTLDIWKNKGLIEQMDRYLWNQGREQQFDRHVDKWLERLRKRIEQNRITLNLAQIDIDNDGRRENVIQYDMGECGDADESSFAMPAGRVFVIFKDNMSEINKDLSKYTRGVRLGMFTYKGRTYLDHFAGSLKFINGKLTVFDSVRHSGGWTELRAIICTYEYKNQTN